MRVALLISGGGTTAEAVIKAVLNGRLKGVEITGVISSKPTAKGIEKAKKLNVPVFVVDPHTFLSRQLFGEKLIKIFDKWNVNLISQNGWLPLTPKNVVSAFAGKIINQHPGPLDPGHADFGGVSMYGSRVMCARIAYSWLTGQKNPWTEATTHWVSEVYDTGALISTKRLQLPALDSIVTLRRLKSYTADLIKATESAQKTLLPIEHTNVIETLRLISTGKTPSRARNKRLVSPDFLELLNYSKQIAKELFPKG